MKRWGDAHDSHENCVRAPRGWPVRPSSHGLHSWESRTHARGGMSPPGPLPVWGSGPPPQAVANSQHALFLLRSDSTPDVQPPSVQFSSFAQPCPTLCNPMNRSTPGLPVHHQLPEFTQTHVHRVRDAIQPSRPLSSPSPPAPNASQHQSLFQ